MSLSHHQFYSALGPFVEPGAIIVISPDSELNSCEGFELFASEKVGTDRLNTNRVRAKENVNCLLDKHPQIDTVAIAGCGSSLAGAAAFGKTVAKAQKKPVAAIVASLGMRDLMTEVMLGALLFQPANLAWGVIDRVLKESREAQRSVRANVVEFEEALAPSVVPSSKPTRKKLSDVGDTLHETAKNTTDTLKKATNRAQEGIKDSVHTVADLFFWWLPKSLTEFYLHPSWLERQILAEGGLKGRELDDFVDGFPSCAVLREFLRRDVRGTLLVGHSKGAYAISAVAWAMMHGETGPAAQTFKETDRIVTFGCGVRLPDGLKRVYQFIGESDILGNLNTPGIHLPFVPREFSIAPETIDVQWQRRTLHTTSTLNPFSMHVADLLEKLDDGRSGPARGEVGKAPADEKASRPDARQAA